MRMQSENFVHIFYQNLTALTNELLPIYIVVKHLKTINIYNTLTKSLIKLSNWKIILLVPKTVNLKFNLIISLSIKFYRKNIFFICYKCKFFLEMETKLKLKSVKIKNFKKLEITFLKISHKMCQLNTYESIRVKKK